MPKKPTGVKKQTKEKKSENRFLPKLSLFFFDRFRLAAVLWVAVTVFGVLSYTTFMQREGFPSISVPFAVVNGTYLANDSSKVDAEVANKISEVALKDGDVKSVNTTARSNFFTVVIQYKDGTSAEEATKRIEQAVKDSNALPKQASVNFVTPKFGFTSRGDDVVITVYDSSNKATTEQLAEEGAKLTSYLKQQNISEVKEVSLINPFSQAVNPISGQSETIQKSFDRFGERQNSSNNFFDSVAVGIIKNPDADIIKADKEIRNAVDGYNKQNPNPQYVSVVSAEFATSIKDQISELQRALLEGLIAVLVIGSIVIAFRASIITVISMFTVLAITIGVLFVAGYTLNTITLFSLILALSLIVDDTIIMVEAIDAQRKRRKDARGAVDEATRRVSKAMIAATSTAALSFAPLIFVGGILGGFIRAIPVTIITALTVSLVVALIFIPLFARFLLLGKKQMGSENVHEIAAGIETRIANFVCKPMIWAKKSNKKLVMVGLTAVFIGFSFIAAGGWLFQKVTFNIFPPTKDSNGLTVSLAFPPGTNIVDAQQVADRADKVVADTLGANFSQASYYASGSVQSADLTVNLLSYKKRDVTAPQLVDQLKNAYQGFSGAEVKVAQQDVGPPSSPFTVRIQTDNREAAFKLATDMNSFLNNTELKRPNGKVAEITTVTVADPTVYTRKDGSKYIEVSAEFADSDTTTLVNLAKTAVEKEFTAEKLASYGLDSNVLVFDFGQESENQDSFKTLAIAFPALLAAIFVLLAIQFRSLLQPLLIFMAIPFSLFGITLGLYLTNNAFSFFAMLGFFALIGLSIKNTILLTDFANQSRKRGSSAVDAAVEALGERFRPLVATSLTAVVSLIPLAILSPFWEGLAVVLIFGLLSSTLLVITVFPYYYLGAEFIRVKTKKLFRRGKKA